MTQTPTVHAGFPATEFAARLARAQSAMADSGLDALLLTTEPDVRYFSGFLTRFWESPTRPWFLVVPSAGKPIAVIPAIGAALMRQSWVDDIRTWDAPDPVDDGVSLLAETLKEICGANGKVGIPVGIETHLRMPQDDWGRVQTLSELTFASDDGIIRQLRMVKSEAEVSKIRTACEIADRAFARVPEIARSGVPLETVFRQFQILCLEEGADWVPYLAGASEQGGYADVISPAGPAPLMPRDVLMLDTGLVREGYFCDFDRNFSVGTPSDLVRNAHTHLVETTLAVADLARPGTTAAKLTAAMAEKLSVFSGATEAGRLGHGLGMQLTEGQSLIAGDHTVLQPGMVFTLEPGLTVGPGKILVHEENIVIREGAPEFLSTPASPDIPILES